MGRLLLTVVDPSGLVVPGAQVTVLALDAGAPRAVAASAETSDLGIATVERLIPGRYTVEAEFAGFARGVVQDVRVRSGISRQVIVLPLERLETETTVRRDAQTVAADPRSRFATTLIDEQIEALSVDADEMEEQLREMAGPGAIVRVDGFEGGRLPPRAQIKSIRITRESFAAEHHAPGHPIVDVLTQPGSGPIRVAGSVRLRDGSMSGRSPLTSTKAPEQAQFYGFDIGGAFVEQKSSFSLSVSRQSAYETPNVYVALPGGERIAAFGPRRPKDNLSVSGLVDHALTRDRTLRVRVQRDGTTTRNLGVGAHDEAERGYSTESAVTNVRIQESGPLGQRFHTKSRLQVGRTESESQPVLEAVTYRVSDTRNTGGAQVRGGRGATLFVAQSDLDYVRGIHFVRTGISVEGGSYQSNEARNYLGTYYFESLAAFEAGRARSYTRRIGDPNIRYRNVQGGIYVQDDIRVRKGLTLSPGVRYELHTHMRDYDSVGPRFGVTWAPFKSGRTTLRAGAGVFYDWLGTGTYEQALLVDGFRQQELNISNPTFPDPGDVGNVRPTNRYLLPDDLQMVRNARVSAGIDQTILPRVRMTVSFAGIRGTGLLRGRNLNAPVDGVRPDPTFANIVQVTDDAEARQRVLTVNTTVSLAAPSKALAQPRFNWKRTSFNVNYTTGKAENNTDGAFSLPFSGSPAGEWGEIPHEIRRHRVNAGVNTTAMRNLNAALTVNAMTGTPYTITTGRDDNRDLVYNDRPAGVGRNTAWTPGFWTLNGTFAYNIPLGNASRSEPRSVPAPASGARRGAGAARGRLAVTAHITNLTNHANYAGFSGVMTSPFFQQASRVVNTRKVDLGLRVNF